MKSVLLETQGRAGQARGGRHPRDLRRRSVERERSSCSTACWCRSAGGRTRRFPGSTRRRCRSTSAASSWSTSSGAPHEPSIFAIGDVVGEPMLAHKASHEGRVAVEVMAGENVAFAPRAIPAVVFTDPGARLGRADRGAGAEGGPEGRPSRSSRGARRAARSRSIAPTA